MRPTLYSALALLCCSGATWAASSQQESLVDSQALVASARAVLVKRLGEAAAGSIVSVVGAPADMHIAQSPFEVVAHPIDGRWPRPRISVPVDIVSMGKVVARATVWFSLSMPTQGMVYSEAYAAGTTSRAVKMMVSEVDAARLAGDGVTGADELNASQLRRGVVAGAPVVRSDFEPVPDISRGQHVSVIIVSGKLHLLAAATSNGSGSIGDMVSVLVDGAETPVRAEVTGKAEVQVAL